MCSMSETRRGTNTFHGAASAYWAPSALVDYETFGAQAYEGNKPWDYSAQRPVQGRYELNLSAQGPIIKDRLFFNAGIQYNRSNAAQPAAAPRFVQAPSRVFESIYLLGGLTFVPADNHRIHTEVFADPTTIDYELTITDPATWTRPWTALVRLQSTDERLQEFACHEGNHHVVRGILGGARAEEK